MGVTGIVLLNRCLMRRSSAMFAKIPFIKGVMVLGLMILMFATMVSVTSHCVFSEAKRKRNSASASMYRFIVACTNTMFNMSKVTWSLGMDQSGMRVKQPRTIRITMAIGSLQ